MTAVAIIKFAPRDCRLRRQHILLFTYSCEYSTNTRCVCVCVLRQNFWVSRPKYNVLSSANDFRPVFLPFRIAQKSVCRHTSKHLEPMTSGRDHVSVRPFCSVQNINYCKPPINCLLSARIARVKTTRISTYVVSILLTVNIEADDFWSRQKSYGRFRGLKIESIISNCCSFNNYVATKWMYKQ